MQAASGWQVNRIEIDTVRGSLPLLVLAGDRPAPGMPPRMRVSKGPACAPDDASVWVAVRAALAELAATLGAAVVEVEPPALSDESAAVRGVLGPGWVAATGREPRHTAVVDLSGSRDDVLARMRPQGRRNVRLGERRGVAVITPPDADAAARALATLTGATAARQHIALPGAAHYRRVLACVPGARVHLATVDGELVAGALVAAFAGEVTYLYGGSTPRHRERQPSAALHAHVMWEAMAAGCTRYDLWGLPPDADPSHPWHGLRQFKLSLGGVEITTAGAFAWVRRPLACRAIGAAAGARRLVRRLRTTAGRAHR